MKQILKSIVSIVLVLFIFYPIEAQKITTEDGVTIISNGKKPKPPKGVPTKLVLEEEMTFGEGDDPDTAFAEVAAFVVDDNGNVYAADFKDRRVKAYDSSGKFLRFIGRLGQGPGELSMPGGIQITPDNELMIEDSLSRRLAYFSLEGEFIKNVSLTGQFMVVTIVLDGKGNMLGRELVMENNEMFFVVKKFDKDLNPTVSLDKIEFPIPIPGSDVKIDIMDLIALYSFDQKGDIVYSRNKDYELKIYNSEGSHIRTIRKDYNRIKVTQDDIDLILGRIPSVGPMNVKEMMDFPEYFPPIQFFLLDEMGRIFVRTWEKGKEEGEYMVDVFDPEGRFIAQFPTKTDLRLWKDQKLYGIYENEEGYRVIKRYKATWGN